MSAAEAQKWLVARLRDRQQRAIAAGHGVKWPYQTNTGWTEVEFVDNVRPSYDLLFMQTFNPSWVADILGRDIEIVEHHADVMGSCDACGAYSPCRTVRLVAQQFLDYTLSPFPEVLRLPEEES